MMHLYCPISGITYKATVGYGYHTQINPAINAPLRHLEELLDKFYNQNKSAEGNLAYTPTRYTYLLAWFNQLPKVHFTTACNPDLDYPTLLLHCERLVSVVQLTKRNRNVKYPELVVSETATIADCLPNWLDAITSAIADNITETTPQSSYAKQLELLTSTLESTRNLDQAHNAAKNAHLVADWASYAGNFPKSVTQLWKDIIVSAMQGNTNLLVSNHVTKADIDELVDHCETAIPHGSYHAHALMKAVREAGDLLDSIKELAASLTTTIDTSIPEPKRSQFPTHVAYIRARMAWQRARTKTQTTKPEPTSEQSKVDSPIVDTASIADLARMLGI